jgi:hypothetical protein
LTSAGGFYSKWHSSARAPRTYIRARPPSGPVPPRAASGKARLDARRLQVRLVPQDWRSTDPGTEATWS